VRESGHTPRDEGRPTAAPGPETVSARSFSLVPPRPWKGDAGGTAVRRLRPESVGSAPPRPERDPGVHPLETARRVIGSEATLQVLWQLFWGAKPFCELMRHSGNLTKRELRITLRAMRDDGLVTRRPAEDPGKDVEYALTPLGEALKPIVASLYLWGLDHARRRRAPLTDASRARAAQAG